MPNVLTTIFCFVELSMCSLFNCYSFPALRTGRFWNDAHVLEGAVNLFQKFHRYSHISTERRARSYSRLLETLRQEGRSC